MPVPGKDGAVDVLDSNRAESRRSCMMHDGTVGILLRESN